MALVTNHKHAAQHFHYFFNNFVVKFYTNGYVLETKVCSVYHKLKEM